MSHKRAILTLVMVCLIADVGLLALWFLKPGSLPAFIRAATSTPRSPTTLVDTSAPTASPTLTPTPTHTPTVTSTPVSLFGRIAFGTALSDGLELQGVATSFPARTAAVYALWDYRSLRGGLPWKMCWYFDGSQRSCESRTWDASLLAASGKALIASIAEPGGLPPGTYRLELFIEERLVQSASFSVVAPTSTPAPPPSATPIPQAGVQEVGRRAALSLVRLEAPAVNKSGSGSIVDGTRGLVLTNWHVVSNRSGDLPPDELVRVFLTMDPDQRPAFAYWARVLDSYSDPQADLAVLEIVGTQDGQTGITGALNLPAIPLGYGAAVRRGDRLILLGYPDYAGDTLSWTEGVVATLDEEWIKTEALASYGSSGGMGVNLRGELVGVITQGEPTGVSQDGVVRSGLLTLLRPVDAARRLIDAAAAGRPPGPVVVQPTRETIPTQRMVVLGVGGLNLRAGPGLQHAVVMEMPLGSVLDVLQSPQWDGERFWYNVRTLSTGRTGWASEFFLATPDIATARILFVSDETGSEDIYSIYPDGSGRQRLTNAPGDEADPGWSPDRRQIAFAYRGQVDCQLYRMNADGGGWQQLTASPGDKVHPVWSPDGNRIAYVSNADGDWELYLLDLGTRQERQLTSNHGWNSYPSWSPDGTRLVFTSRQTGNYDLFLLDVDSGQASQLTTSPYTDAHGTWSPQGNEIVYTMVVAEAGGLVRGIGVLDVRDPAHPRRVTFGDTGSVQFRFPDWSPDGRFIVVVSGEGPQYDLNAAPARGSTMVTLTSAFSQSSIAPTWSR